jgi:hypothetical protein
MCCIHSVGLRRKALRWCQGKVIEVLTIEIKLTVSVSLDPILGVEGKEDLGNKTQQILLPHKWNKDMWRVHGGSL